MNELHMGMKEPAPATGTTSRVFLVDDHPMLVAGLRSLIENDAGCTVCGQASNAADAMEMIPLTRPDLVIMDLTLPDKSGLDLLRDLQAMCPEIPVLVFSMHDEMLYAERVVRAGGRGYLVKGSDAAQFVEAIREVLAGSLYLSKRVSRHILNRMSPGVKPDPVFGPATLTDRELEIFQLLGQGLNTAQIGGRLHISTRTVDAHRNNIRLKLALPDAAAVMREAVIWVELGSESTERPD